MNRLGRLLVIPFLFLFSIALPHPSAASSDPQDGDTVEFNSDQFVSVFWQKKNPGKEFVYTRVKAKFRRPEGDGPFPAVILVHGCAGPQSNLAMWSRWWVERGYATIAPNSFAARGHKEICTDFQRVTQTERVEDVYGAVNYLASLPFIDSNTIILMGFSNGAGTVMDAVSVSQARRMERAKGRIAASFPLYPECRFHTPPYAVPMMIMIGEQDDWTLAESCRFHEQMRGEQPLEVKIYPGAHHAYDEDANAFLPRVRNPNSASGYGATIRSSRTATAASKADIDLFLDRLAGQ